MTGDRRQTWGLIIDVLDVYERHGYKRGNHRQIGRAVSFIGEIGRIYEGSQDAPAGMDLGEPQPSPSAATPELGQGPQSAAAPGAGAAAIEAGDRQTILVALDEAAEYKRDRAAACADCADQSCGTCQYRLQMAAAYDQVAARLLGERQARPPGATARDPEPHRPARQGAAAEPEAVTDRDAAADREAER